MKYTGLIGYPVAHSLSPRMQEAGFAALGIEACYELWETPAAALADRINSLRSPDFLGANVTIPHKEAVLPWLDEYDAQAARIGAVNTIVNRAGRLIGYNTDAPGFLRALQEQAGPDFALHSKQMVILGSGGAARGAAVALLDSQVASLSILGRTREHIEALLTDLGRHAGRSILHGAVLETSEAAQILSQADVVVNTTSVGLKTSDQTVLIDIEQVQRSALVMDMIFNPPQTPLLRAAQERGCVTLNGLSMLLYQGTLALELWTDQPAPVEVMRAALGLE
ncbi:MAG TPA: shikimate dehydrogenase [Ktedonobacteraceae bacterium]|nr:shikimate dehydrogenase [Ktedonobacteraceae bacterium]